MKKADNKILTPSPREKILKALENAYTHMNASHFWIPL